ncbi:MAG: hypothetical protein LBH97_01415, partial [Treponema sp.]|nr:hypothetical protein [Treponema sp.]
MIFILYVGIASLLIMGFRCFFPGEAAPLPIFSRNWQFIRGALDLFTLFPALAFSALVIPFGIASLDYDYFKSFSPKFFQHLMVPVITAICAAVVYGLIFFLFLPLVRNAEANMRYQGELYQLAKERAYSHGEAGEWREVSHFIGVCDSVWPQSPELVVIRNELAINLEQQRYAAEDRRAAARAEMMRDPRSAAVSPLPGQSEPPDAATAIGMAEQALSEGRFFDAHWLATLAERIAKEGSPETASARRLAARAWNRIESQSPSSRENRFYSLYLLKRSGYEAMISNDWIRGFYIFQELLDLSPDDPDAANYLAICEKGVTEIAFFIDELKMSAGELLTGAVFSLPTQTRGGVQGRAVLRFSSISVSPDFAYGIGIEYFSFDAQSRPLVHLEAPYAKLLPVTLDGRHQLLIMMRALNRHDRSLRWEPEWTIEPGASYRPGDAQIILDVDFETFIMLTQIRQGLANMQLGELFTAAEITGSLGYVPEVFEAEILNRLGAALFFLPMSIFSIVIGWCFRARSRPRYLFFILLPVLPIVFTGLVHLYQIVLNIVGIWLIIA